MAAFFGRVQRHRGEARRLLGRPARRIALCGAEILGVKAFGPYVVCTSCLVVRWWVWGQ
ncbi:MAG: hypothetical protein WKF65_13410 [Gaiellaceae bacterium]